MSHILTALRAACRTVHHPTGLAGPAPSNHTQVNGRLPDDGTSHHMNQDSSPRDGHGWPVHQGEHHGTHGPGAQNCPSAQTPMTPDRQPNSLDMHGRCVKQCQMSRLVNGMITGAQ